MRNGRNVLFTDSLICGDIPAWVLGDVLHICSIQKMTNPRSIGVLIGIAADLLAAPASASKVVLKTG